MKSYFWGIVLVNLLFFYFLGAQDISDNPNTRFTKPQRYSTFYSPNKRMGVAIGLNHERTNFQYQPVFNIKNPAIEIERGLKTYFIISNEIEDFFSDKNCKTKIDGVQLAVWSVFYNNKERLNLKKAEKNTYISDIISLFSISDYANAEKRIKEILSSHQKDQYAILVLAGLYSIHDKSYFPFLKKAFAISPEKTIYIINWQVDCLRIEMKDDDKWDFIDGFLSLLADQKNDWLSSLDQMHTLRLYNAIYEKYLEDASAISGEKLTKLKALDSLLKAHLQTFPRRIVLPRDRSPLRERTP